METLLSKVERRLGEEIHYDLSFPRPRRLLFDHIPKCGGSTMNLYLEAQYPKRTRFSLDGCCPQPSVDEFKDYSQVRRYSYRLIKGHLAHKLVDYVHPDTMKVTVLREPIDRMISHYFFARRMEKHYLHDQIVQSGMTLEQYVESGLSDELNNWYTTHYSGLSAEEAGRDPQAAVAKAVEVIRRTYHLVGFLDRFCDFTEKLKLAARFKTSYGNQCENVTKGRPACDDIPESVLRKIEHINHMDIAFYKQIRELYG